jgi:hypothetical protein
VDVKGCGRLSVHDVVYWTLHCFVCAQVSAVQRWGRLNVLFVVVVGESASSLGETEGFVWKVSASCHQHICMTSNRYVCLRGLSRPEHALVIQGGSLGGVGMVE